MEKILKVIKLFSSLSTFSKYLKNGFYLVTKNKDKYFLKRAKFGMPLFTFRKKQHYIFAEIILSPKERKVIFLTNDLAFHFYDRKRFKPEFFDNVNQFGEKIKYPINKPILLDYKKRLKVEHVINGHQVIPNVVLNKLLDYAIESEHICSTSVLKKWPFVKKEDIFYVQHGDASKRNIIFVKNEPVFIDLDDIGIYPAFYDFFRFMIRNPKSINSFVNGDFDDKIIAVLGKANTSIIDKNELIAILDYYLYLFLTISEFDIFGLNSLIPAEFVLSKKAITKNRKKALS